MFRLRLLPVVAALQILACFFCGLQNARAASADVVTIRFDARPGPGPGRAEGDPVAAGDWPKVGEFGRYERWAHVDDAAHPFYPVSSSNSVAVLGAVDGSSRAGLEVVNLADDGVQIQIQARLPVGLWRVDIAVLRKNAGTAELGVPPASWRMESVLQSETGLTVKRFPLAVNEALFLRWTETGASAREARKAVRRACWTTSDRALQDRVSGALMPVDDILDALPTLVARGDRKKITTRIHTALLATAKAQALWDNGRGDSITDRDSAFTGLVTALSEVSCACFDLVPSETLIPAATAGGKPEIRVTLTNAGSRTIPLVALGIDRRDGASPGSDRTVYRSVAPGATVSARFPTADPDAVRGIVQFLSDMGAATVAAAPDAPTPPVNGGD